MSEDVPIRASGAPMGDGDSGAEIDALRRLLLAPEQDKLSHIQERLDDPNLYARDLSKVLPEAIALRLGRDKNLTRAIAPAVVDVLQDSIRKNPRMLADAFFPIMGPAIRKAIRATLGDMVESINQVVEHTFTVRGLTWRIEALRTGRPFGEIVLLRSLIYRVEQVYLIHRETGLLLLHVVADSSPVRDADMASAMLTAIRDFVRDTFAADGESVEALSVGEVKVLVEQGPHAILAAVVRGSPHPELRDVLRDELETIHLEHIEDLAAFAGDPAPFETCEDNLDRCLKARYEAQGGGVSPVVWGALAVLVILLGWWIGVSLVDRWRWNAAMAQLRAQPGVVLTFEERGWRRYRIGGLRDPLAPDPSEVLTNAGIQTSLVDSTWEPYLAAHPPFVLSRARTLLQPPDTVTLKVAANGALVVTGVADTGWIDDARRLGPLVPGITGFDASAVSDAASAILERSREQVQSQIVPFASGSSELTDPGKSSLADVLSAIRALDEAASAQGARVRVDVIGHADASGQDSVNNELSARRADAIKEVLDALDLKATSTTARGAGTLEPVLDSAGKAAAESNRSVSFGVTIEKTARPKGHT